MSWTPSQARGLDLFGKERNYIPGRKHPLTPELQPHRWKGDFNALIDVGTGDNFYKQGQLLPENLEKAAKEAGIKGLEVRYQPVSTPTLYINPSSPSGCPLKTLKRNPPR